MNTNENITDYIDFFIECYWEKDASGRYTLMCNTTPVNSENNTYSISDDYKSIINEFVKKRINIKEYKMCDVARMRVFPNNDVKPVFLLLVEPKANSNPHNLEVIYFNE